MRAPRCRQSGGSEIPRVLRQRCTLWAGRQSRGSAGVALQAAERQQAGIREAQYIEVIKPRRKRQACSRGAGRVSSRGGGDRQA